MYIAIMALTISVMVHVVVYLYVCKKTKTYFNYFTLDLSITVIIQLIPFMLGIINGKNKISNYDDLITLAFIIIISQIAKMVGYLIGYKTTIKELSFRSLAIPVSNKTIRKIELISIVLMIFSFLGLSNRGGGLAYWIFDNRNAYLYGRNGNGIFYILFQLSLIVSMISVWMDYYQTKKRKWLILAIVVCSYFSGSKGVIISLVLLILFLNDHYIKKIKLRRIIYLGVVGIIALNILLYVQSGMTLFQYVSGDYYSNFLNLIRLRKEGNLEFYFGRLYFEDFFWMLIPRALYNNKPYVYGTTTFTALFYGEAMAAAGHTPSFSSFAVPYADFGVVGIVMIAIIDGCLYGYLENNINRVIRLNGVTFIPLIVYTIFMILKPINLVWIYKFVFIGVIWVSLKIFRRRNYISNNY